MDLSMVADLTLANKPESDAASSNEKHAVSKNQEPNDLFVVLQRDSRLDSTEGSRTMDYEIDFSLPKTDIRSSFDHSHDKLNEKLPASLEKTSVTKSKTSGTRSSEKDEKSKALRSSARKGKPEILFRARKPFLPSRPIVQKRKREHVFILTVNMMVKKKMRLGRGWKNYGMNVRGELLKKLHPLVLLKKKE
ncbi:hypothetical protein VIGAN_01212400 [Vigna angularis var. angularis]|uniref:Uncharacterized protein n=1 Tax=Vigna angularis var. angularis TaxID=157739 RepID=A0A0S3R1F8_PHAAN|nr:hypothetical protein VIGAN_01212400 [Vigna angularis var. angularis]